MRLGRKLIALALSLSASGFTWSKPVDFPQLNADDISVTNNLTDWGIQGQITFEIKGEKCDRVRIVLTADKTEKISCAGAKYFIAYLHVTKLDGSPIDKEVKLPTGAHYWFGWDATDFKSLTLNDVRLR